MNSELRSAFVSRRWKFPLCVSTHGSGDRLELIGAFKEGAIVGGGAVVLHSAINFDFYLAVPAKVVAILNCANS